MYATDFTLDGPNPRRLWAMEASSSRFRRDGVG